MAEFQFLVRMSVVLLANAEGALNYFVDDKENLEINGIYQKSTGAFDIVSISGGGGRQYSNAKGGDTLDGNFIQDVEETKIGFSKFPEPIILPGGVKFEIIVKDTSGAGNTVEMMLVAKRVTDVRS